MEKFIIKDEDLKMIETILEECKTEVNSQMLKARVALAISIIQNLDLDE